MQIHDTDSRVSVYSGSGACCGGGGDVGSGVGGCGGSYGAAYSAGGDI